MKSLFVLWIGFFSFFNIALGFSDNKLTIQSGGLKRYYYLHIPKNYVKGVKRPLIITLHGGGQSAKDMISFTKFDSYADLDTVFVAYPVGIDDKWNDGRIHAGEDVSKKPNDVQFISDVIEDVSKKFDIDADKISVVGFGSGGILCFKLACELSDKINAIATVGASMATEVYNNCKPNRIVNVLAINGQDDKLIPFNGGKVMMDNVDLGSVAGIEQVLFFMANYNSTIKANPLKVKKRDLDHTDHTTVVTWNYTNNYYGTDLILYEIKGGGHAWPGTMQYLPEDLVGNISRELSASSVIWDFISKTY
jgi:polyhydroxybutyrate depolymerase